jgi:hypothetical protein
MLLPDAGQLLVVVLLLVERLRPTRRPQLGGNPNAEPRPGSFRPGSELEVDLV